MTGTLSSYQQRPELASYNNLKDVVRPVCARLTLGLILLIVYYLSIFSESYSQTTSAWIRLSNMVGPTSLLGLTLISVYSIVRRYPTAVWTPVLFYFLGTGIFFGLGPLVYPFGSESTRYFLSHNTVTSLTDSELFRTNFLNAVGTFSATLTIYILLGFKYFQTKALPIGLLRQMHKASLASTAIFFVSVGIALRFFVILPYAFGLTTFIVPGVVNTLGGLTDLGFTIIAYLAVKQGGHWGKALWIIWPIHILTVLLEFKKSVLVLALLLPALGSYLASGKTKKLMLWVSVIAVIYYLSQPFVHYGRDIIKAKTGFIEQATLGERYQITKSYFTQKNILFFQDDGTSNQGKDSIQGAWTRLAYSGPQSFGMREYDAGRPGTTLRNAWVVFIPRLLWPDKPVGIGPGRAFYETVTGHSREAYLGLSIYGDGYWQGGWAGLITLSSFTGVIFLLMSKFAIEWIEKREMIFLPAIFVSIQMALLGTTGFFVNKILGALPIYLAYIIAVNLLLSILPKCKQ